MVTMNQVQNGLVKYIDTDILPHLTGIRKVGLGMYSALASQNIGKTILKYKDHPAIAMIDVIDENGNVDIDKLYQAAVPMFANGEKQSIDIPLIGELRIDRTDIEKLYQYIRG